MSQDTQKAVSYDPHPIRWIDLVLPHPEDPDRWLTLKADGPFALRHWYYAPGTHTEIRLHLHVRTPDGGLNGCLHCGKSPLYTRKKVAWKAAMIGMLPGVVLAFFLPWFGLAWVGLAVASAWFLGTHEIVCYACGSQHRGFRPVPVHGGFDSTVARTQG